MFTSFTGYQGEAFHWVAINQVSFLISQAWCSGRVGMYGKSWGGFNGLQVAALQPPPLKAVISLFSTGRLFTSSESMNVAYIT